MRLTELSPRYLINEAGEKVGFTFLCPCCKKDWLTCWTTPAPRFREQVQVMHRAFNTTPEDEYDWPIEWVPCTFGCKWTVTNLEDFNKLTAHPSIDASKSGNWHGHIKKGEITS